MAAKKRSRNETLDVGDVMKLYQGWESVDRASPGGRTVHAVPEHESTALCGKSGMIGQSEPWPPPESMRCHQCVFEAEYVTE
jgi:hypothetical protein